MLQDEALIAAATLSDRYIPDRKQPDKSIDLVDEACSRLRLEQESKPEIIWKVERDLLTKQIELSALANEEDDPKSVARRRQVESDVNQMKEELEKLTNIWEEERKELERAKTVQERLDQAKRALEKARRDGDFATAGELQHGTIPNLRKELEELENESDVDKGKGNPKMLAEFVSGEAVATCVAKYTGIPVSKITGNESDKLLHMEQKLKEVSSRRYEYMIMSHANAAPLLIGACRTRSCNISC